MVRPATVRFWILAAWIFRPAPAVGQIGGGVNGRPDSPRSIRIGAAGERPRINGRLDDSVWATAESIADFRQREPIEGIPASERTVVRVVRDAEALYIAVRCYDSDLRRVRARQLRRAASATRCR